MMILMLTIVWGGLVVLLAMALVWERGKAHSEVE